MTQFTPSSVERFTVGNSLTTQASEVRSLIVDVMPTAYASPENGYTPEVIERHLEAAAIEKRFRQAHQSDSAQYLLARNIDLGKAHSPALDGMTKVTDQSGIRDAREIEELLTRPVKNRRHLAAGLLWCAIEGAPDEQLVVGQILGYNRPALVVADQLGMRRVKQVKAYPFPLERNLKQKLTHFGRVDWSYYGAEAGDLRSRLVEAYPWLRNAARL